jgi:DNA-binding MarR family transcriptional regulator
VNVRTLGRVKASEEERELKLLEALAEAPGARQIDLAVRVGLAVGTVNWHLKRLAAKGLIKVQRIGQWRWHYLLTPQGLAEKAKLTAAYVQISMVLYRQTRARALELLEEIRRAGYARVRLVGAGELLEICRLTCLEQGMQIVSDERQALPVIHQEGRELRLEWPKEA